MAIYAIGDLHLSFDENVDKGMEVFGESWENHEERIAKSWKKKVNSDDYVLVCGDLSWGLKFEEAMADINWVNDLPGNKIIIKGNHDLWWQSYKKIKDAFQDSTMNFLQNNCYMIDDGKKKVAICGTRGWNCPGTEPFTAHDEKVYKREAIRLKMSLDSAMRQKAEEIIVCLHFPPTNENFEQSDFVTLMKEYPVKTCVYGHLHNKEVFPKGLKGLVDGIEYKLVSLDYLNADLEKIRD